MLSLRENMLLVYHHQTPEFLPLLSDIQRIRSVEPGFKNVLFHGKKAGKEEVDWFGQNWVYEPMVKAFNPDSTNYIIKDITRWLFPTTYRADPAAIPCLHPAAPMAFRPPYSNKYPARPDRRPRR